MAGLVGVDSALDERKCRGSERGGKGGRKGGREGERGERGGREGGREGGGEGRGMRLKKEWVRGDEGREMEEEGTHFLPNCLNS